MNFKESLHRLAKAVVDSGAAESFEEAAASLQNLHLNVFIGEEISDSRSLQAAFGTIINAGGRSLLGGITVVSDGNYQINFPWSKGYSIKEISEEYGATFGTLPNPDAPSIVLGTIKQDIVGTCVMQVTFDNWDAAVIPWGDKRLSERDSFPISGVLAGALAVSEAMQSTWGSNSLAGRRRLVTSLWSPGQHVATSISIPEILDLPSKLWVLGLGHLGQAVLWTLGFLPYDKPGEVNLILQDFDTIGPANNSTCLLVKPGSCGQKKTRWVASRCEARGFKTTICERAFSPNWKVNDDDPEILLCLPDNVSTRLALETSPFRFIIEAGLGSSFDTYTRFSLHTFPGARRPIDYWNSQEHKIVEFSDLPSAYLDLHEKGLDECGIVEVAGVAVGAPFVGTVAACFVVSEIVRLLNGGKLYDVIQGDLQNIGHLKAIEKLTSIGLYNYGITASSNKLSQPSLK